MATYQQGATGKSFLTADNGAITVRYQDGTSKTVQPTDANYAVTKSAMNTDIASYKPSNSVASSSTSGLLGNQSVSNTGSIWNNYTGGTGKQYSVADNGTINVTYKDGTSRLVHTGDADYSTTHQAMKADIAGAGGTYTPTNSYYNADSDKVYNSVSYTRDNQALTDAMQKYIKDNGLAYTTVNDFVNKGVLNSGQSQEAIANELLRLGLGDYLNGIYTASGTVLPNNQFVTYTNGANGVSDSFGGADKTWANYGGQSYLIGGQGANYATYANGKTGNLNNAYYLYNDATKNPYMASDPEMMAAYNQQLQKLGYNPSTWGTSGTASSTNTTLTPTGNANVDAAINLIGGLNNYNAANGTSGGNYGNEILQALASGKDALLELIANQRKQAQLDSENQSRQAYVNNQLAQSRLGEQMSAIGRGTSGALQQAELGLQTDFSNNINTINSNLMKMLSSLDENELQMLADYYNNSAQWKYQLDNDAWNRQQQAQEFAYKQQQDAIANEMARQELLMRQQQYDNQTLQSQAKYLGDMLDSGLIDGNTYYQEMNKLGLVGSDLTILNNSARSTGSSGGTSVGGNDDWLGGGNDAYQPTRTVTQRQGQVVDPLTVDNGLGVTRYYTGSAQAQQQMADSLANQGTKVRYVNGQTIRDGYADGSFDVVNANGGLTHYPANFRSQYGI